MKKLTVSVFLLSNLLRADCVDGVRKLNAAEQKMFDEVAAAFAAALPQPPESWKLSSGNATPLRPALCTGTPSGRMSVSTSMLFRYMNPPKARTLPEETEIKRLSDEIEALQRVPDDLRKQINEVQARQSEKRRASMAAEKAGNAEQARQLRREADEISNGADKIRKDYLASVEPQIRPREARIKELRSQQPDYSTEILLMVTANEQTQMPAAGKGLNEDVYVWGLKTPVKAATTVQSVVLKVKGWPDYREIIAGRIDMARLRALVKQE